jgi:N-terminal domain of reverse transcriptase
MHENYRANGPKERCNWAEVDWAKARRAVKNLRQRIFRAASEGDLCASGRRGEFARCVSRVR